MKHMRGGLFFCAASLCCAAGPALGQINYVNISGGVLGDRIALEGIGVPRGATPYGYDESELISPTLEAINVPSAGLRTVLLYADPLDSNRGQALSDRYINTGFLDPGTGNGSFAAGSEYVRLGFGAPVYNHPGPDLLFFNIGFQFSTGVLGVYPFHFSFDGATSHLFNQDRVFTLGAVDQIPYYAFPGGITAPSELTTEMPTHTGYLGNPPTAIPRPLIYAIDLGDYGIAAGDTIDTLYLQDASGDSRDFYPTLVAGLPPIPEPATGLILLVGSLVVTRRRSRR